MTVEGQGRPRHQGGVLRSGIAGHRREYVGAQELTPRPGIVSSDEGVEVQRQVGSTLRPRPYAEDRSVSRRIGEFLRRVHN